MTHIFADQARTLNAPPVFQNVPEMLQKIDDFSGILQNYNTYWKIVGPSSTLTHQAIKCVILTPLVKCAQNGHRMTHNIAIQRRMFDGPQLRQNDNEFKNFQVFKKTIQFHCNN